MPFARTYLLLILRYTLLSDEHATGKMFLDVSKFIIGHIVQPNYVSAASNDAGGRMLR